MTGIERIAAERARQVKAEGFDESRDDAHSNHELARLAATYAMPPHLRALDTGGDQLPCSYPTRHDEIPDPEKPETKIPRGVEHQWWKPMNGGYTIAGRIRELEKAGSLCAAEIDRLQREADAQEKGAGE